MKKSLCIKGTSSFVCLILGLTSFASAQDSSPTPPPADKPRLIINFDPNSSPGGVVTGEANSETKKVDEIITEGDKDENELKHRLDKTKIVCESRTVTGSRLKKRKVCQTVEAWTAQEEYTQRRVNSLQGYREYRPAQ